MHHKTRVFAAACLGGTLLLAGGCGRNGMMLAGAFLDGMAQGIGSTPTPPTSATGTSRAGSSSRSGGSSSSYVFGTTPDGRSFSRSERVHRWSNGSETRSVFGVTADGGFYSGRQHRERP